jgi:hypothetical protein
MNFQGQNLMISDSEEEVQEKQEVDAISISDSNAEDEEPGPTPSQSASVVTGANSSESEATRSASFVWHYFVKLQGSNPAKARCKHCHAALTLSRSTTSNLINHLKLHKITNESHMLNSIVDTSSKVQVTLREALARGFDQKNFEREVLKYLIMDDAPFATVQSRGKCYLRSSTQGLCL